jgi:hypothetical protein
MDDSSSLRIHFVHKRSSAADAIPLLYIHGFPGSFLEVSKILDPLTSTIPTHLANESPSFHVVAPSVPGFGFSDASMDDNFGARSTARCFDLLMRRLGYEKYVVECSSQGWKVARWFVGGGNGCVAVHTIVEGTDQFVEDVIPESLKEESKGGWSICKKTIKRPPLKNAEKEPVVQQEQLVRPETKPLHLPQTIAHGLCDSPAGLLASCLNQLYDMGNLHLWSQTEVLNWTMLQWLPGPEAGLRWSWATDEETFEQFEEKFAHVGITAYEQPQELADTGLGISMTMKTPDNLTLFNEGDAKIRITWSRIRSGKAGIPALDSPSDVIVDLREFCARGRRDGWLRDFSPAVDNAGDNDVQIIQDDETQRDEDDEAEKRTLETLEVEDEVSRASQWSLLWRWISTNLKLRRGKRKNH